MSDTVPVFLNRRSQVRLLPGLLELTGDGQPETVSFGTTVGSVAKTALPGIADRLWSKVEIKGEDECWPWKGARRPTGHGNFGLNGHVTSAARVAYVLVNGPVEDGLDVMHSCDNGWCLNPAHLSQGTRSQNMLDCSRRGRIYRRPARRVS